MLKNKKMLFRLLIISSALGLSACQSKIGCFEGKTQCFGSSKSIFKNTNSSPTLNPEFNYIRFKMNGNVAWLAQGALDQWPSSNTKVYYSADRSVFRWSNGRLISVTHPDFNWRERLDSQINWSSPTPIQFTRELDTIDGKIAVKEQREINKSAKPDHEDYVGDKTNLVWMHEHTISKSPVMEAHPSYDNWYAFETNNLNEPVYGQHCISNTYCLSWQVWKPS